MTTSPSLHQRWASTRCMKQVCIALHIIAYRPFGNSRMFTGTFYMKLHLTVIECCIMHLLITNQMKCVHFSKPRDFKVNFSEYAQELINGYYFTIEASVQVV